MDEDPPEDIDNDGMILTMRWKDSKKGNLIPDPKDSTGRANDIFNSIDMAGNDTDLNRSFAAPTVRIAEMQIGGK